MIMSPNFSKSSQVSHNVPRCVLSIYVPNSTSILSHMVCPKLNSPEKRVDQHEGSFPILEVLGCFCLLWCMLWIFRNSEILLLNCVPTLVASTYLLSSQLPTYVPTHPTTYPPPTLPTCQHGTYLPDSTYQVTS
jgi:hypothetical protein